MICFDTFRDACTTAPNPEYSNDNATTTHADFSRRKSSLLSSASDYARSIHVEQPHHSNVARASSPYNDKTVSFFDERVKTKSK